MAAGAQTAPPAALSSAMRELVKNGRFDVVTSVRGLPLGVRDELQTMFGSNMLDIAEPGAEFQMPGARVNRSLPLRRLAVAGCSMAYCLVYYERGGAARTWLLAMFHWTPAATRFVWGGAAPGGLASLDDVRSAVLSGANKSSTKLW